MSPGLHILAAVLDGVAAAVLVYWGVALYRLAKTSLSVPTLRAGFRLGKTGPGDQPELCLVIPAHNEEASIGALVQSLRFQDYPSFRTVLCLDRCTDRTEEIARREIGTDPRIEVLKIEECPEGWAGKVHAVWRGTQTPAAQRAALLLFADADCAFEPMCLTAAVGLLQHRRLDLLSLLSTLTAKRGFELFVQPAAGLELVRQYPIDRANRPPSRRRRPFANGQFMLFRREAYEAVGGHEGVKDELLEDLALARRIGEAGRPAGLFLADGLVRCRMYESWDAFRKGWKRIYIESAKCKVKRLRTAALVAGLLGGVLPLLTVANWVLCFLMYRATVARMWEFGGTEDPGAWRLGLALSGAALAAYGAVVLATYRMGRAPLWAAVGFPVGSLLVSRILGEAARDLKRGVPTRWAGREYVRVAR